MGTARRAHTALGTDVLGGDPRRSIWEALLGLELAADGASELKPVLRLSPISSTPTSILLGRMMPDPVRDSGTLESAWDCPASCAAEGGAAADRGVPDACPGGPMVGGGWLSSEPRSCAAQGSTVAPCSSTMQFASMAKDWRSAPLSGGRMKHHRVL